MATGQLKREHAALLSAFAEINQIGIGTAAGLEKLRACKAALLDHLREEDTRLYPVLHQGAAKDDELRWKLETLAGEMLEVTRVALEFFARHAAGLGACWNGLLQDAAAGRHLRGFDGLRKLLAIPEGHQEYAAATIGFPAVRLHSVPQREVSIEWIG